MNTQPESLRLADALEKNETYDDEYGWQPPSIVETEAAAELRRLHSINAELLEALKELRAEFVTTVDGE